MTATLPSHLEAPRPMSSFIARHADAPPVPIYPNGMTAEACKRRAQRALALLMLSDRGRRCSSYESYAHEAARVAAEIRTAIRKAGSAA